VPRDDRRAGLRIFEPVPAVARKLSTLLDVGLGYITLGQSATTLSGERRSA
jgi:excinuclease ABC subunit A